MTSKDEYKSPKVTVDIIIEVPRPKGSIAYGTPHIVMIRRANTPLGFAIPGGFVDYGEPPWKAAIREAKEETNLDIELIEFFHAYGNPKRDARVHAVSLVFLAKAEGVPVAGDDAKEAMVYDLDIAEKMVSCFDHDIILSDFSRYKSIGIRPEYNK